MISKKKFLASILAISIVAALAVGTTLAYLNDKTDEVTNTFTVGNLDIDLTEAKVDEFGVVDETATDRVTANDYKLMPNSTYVKDPTVFVNPGSEACWLFVKVENGIAAAEVEGDTSIATQITTNGWTKLTGVDNVYWQKAPAVATNASEPAKYPVFNSFKLQNIDLSSYEGKTIKITAYAIQQATIADDAAAAWTAGGWS